MDAGTPTLLRTLSILAGGSDPHRTDAVEAVSDYVPAAVAYTDDPDLEIPLPDPHFGDHVAVLIAATSTSSDRGRPVGKDG